MKVTLRPPLKLSSGPGSLDHCFPTYSGARSASPEPPDLCQAGLRSLALSSRTRPIGQAGTLACCCSLSDCLRYSAKTYSFITFLEDRSPCSLIPSSDSVFPLPHPRTRPHSTAESSFRLRISIGRLSAGDSSGSTAAGTRGETCHHNEAESTLLASKSSDLWLKSTRAPATASGGTASPSWKPSLPPLACSRALPGTRTRAGCLAGQFQP